MLLSMQNISKTLSVVHRNIDIDGKMLVISLATGNTGMYASKQFIYNIEECPCITLFANIFDNNRIFDTLVNKQQLKPHR